MNIALTCQAARQPSTPVPLMSSGVSIAGVAIDVQILDSMQGAEPFWRALEHGQSLVTPYQRFDQLAAWQRHVGSPGGITPFIVVASDATGQPLFLWPFGLARRGPLRLIRFLGSKHSNFNLGLWRRDILDAITAEDITGILHRLNGGADLVMLFNQPMYWDGARNPFLQLPHQASVDMSAVLDLRAATGQPVLQALSASLRSRLRNKERKLRELPGYRYIQAASAEDIDRLLDVFFELKATHMAAQGLENVFAEPGVTDFLREACHGRLPDQRPVIEIHALESATEVLAVFGAIVDDYRCSTMFNTYTLGENMRHSPGLLLLVHMIDACSVRGIRTFDIGVGRAHYKSFFCREPEPLYDSFIALSRSGRLAAAAFAAAFCAKRTIKENAALWAAVQTWRS
jgi:CelD/BcsL family acetyltransferase involved in cellulose biosynthesis